MTAETTGQKYASFTLNSMVVMVVGPDKLLPELRASAQKPQLVSDLLWLVGKLLKDKINRDLLIGAFSLPGVVRELLSHLGYSNVEIT